MNSWVYKDFWGGSDGSRIPQRGDLKTLRAGISDCLKSLIFSSPSYFQDKYSFKSP